MGEPIRVAHVIGKLNAAGVEAVVNNYYRNIDHSKFQFDYIIDSDGECKPPQELIDLGARYFVVPPYQKLPQHIKALTKIFRDNKYQIVHSGMNTLAPISMFCAWRAGVPVRINHNHSTAGKGETKRNILKYMLRPFAKCFATHFAACSKYAGEWLFGKRMMQDKTVTVFNNAIDVKKFSFNSVVRNEVRKEIGIEDKYVIGHVGRFCFQKNHEFLIDIFKAVHETDSNAMLLLVGIGDLQKQIKEKVKNYGLEDSVIFLGVRKDVDRLYQAMDIFVLPSHYEGLPVVGVEAQAAGLPCLLSDQMTKETVILPETKMMPLTVGAKKWAWQIVKMQRTKRRNTTEDIRKAGFDIGLAANELEIYYDKLCHI
ncbi:glycosyltransferase family 1 protein [Ruminococcus sp.]|uniref:glycosyltransferase family 1 protein n=1 Tax=Ruminococcus sp. TaxID=41978 RepID=UPI0025DAA854|nr:glycosyltransferase family 1 protein [Ruminococcus sp.]